MLLHFDIKKKRVTASGQKLQHALAADVKIAQVAIKDVLLIQKRDSNEQQKHCWIGKPDFSSTLLQINH